MTTDALKLEDYALREDDMVFDGRVNHILRVNAVFPITEDDSALLLALGPRLDAHFPAREPSPQLGFFEGPGAYDVKLRVLFSPLNHPGYWRVAHKKWHETFASLAQAVSKVYNRLLLAPDYWACTKKLEPRRVEKCQHRKAHQTPQDIRLEGLADEVKSYDLLLVAPTREELERMIAYHQAKAA